VAVQGTQKESLKCLEGVFALGFAAFAYRTRLAVDAVKIKSGKPSDDSFAASHF
jgi:hypothetical protein